VTPDSPPESDPLRLLECPACGYALEGLPREGICPECGVAYRPGVIVLHGFGTELATGRTKTVVTGVVANALVVAYFSSKWTRGGRFDWFDVLYPTYVLVWTGRAVWKRWQGNMPWPVQIWLGPDGARQVNNPTAGTITPGPLTPWERIKEVRIESVKDDAARVRLTGPTTFWRGQQVMFAEVQCSRERAVAVRDQVRAWPAAASAPRRKSEAAT